MEYSKGHNEFMITSSTALLPYLDRFRDMMAYFRRLEDDDRWLYDTTVCEDWEAMTSDVYLFGPQRV